VSKRVLILAAGLIAAGVTWAPAEPAKPAMMVLLKADDYRDNTRWRRFVGYLQEKQLKASIGIICNILEKDDPKLVAWTHELTASGAFDFWHHGYDHRLNWQEGGRTFCEFDGPSYEQQKDHFDRACRLAKDKLGIEFKVFGAPGNKVDANTARVLADHPEIEATFFGPKGVPGKLVLERWANAEQPTLKPNSAEFIKRWPRVESKPYLVLQLHPGAWDDERFAEFTRIVTFLQGRGVRFVTARELCGGLRGK